MTKPAEPIPVVQAEFIASRYGYDQVVIIARRVGPVGVEHVTTYGSGDENRWVATRMGEFLKRLMGWKQETVHQDWRTK